MAQRSKFKRFAMDLALSSEISIHLGYNRGQKAYQKNGSPLLVPIGGQPI